MVVFYIKATVNEKLSEQQKYSRIGKKAISVASASVWTRKMTKSKKQRKAAQKADINRILQVTKATDLAELQSRKATAKAIFTKSRHQVLIFLQKENCNIESLEEKQQEVRNNFNNLLECLSAFSDLLKVECDTKKLEKTTLEIEKAEEEFGDVVDRIQTKLHEINSVSYEQRKGSHDVVRTRRSDEYNKMSTKDTDRVNGDEFDQNSRKI